VYFQTLDSKNECFGIFCNDKIYYSRDKLDIDELTHTWAYADYLKDNINICYAQLYCGGKTLQEACPKKYQEHMDEVSLKLKAYIRSMNECKLSMKEHCFYDFVPKKVLHDLCELKNKISLHIFKNYTKPDNYETLLELTRMLNEISNRKIEYDISALNHKKKNYALEQFTKKMQSIEPYINYDQYKSKTGRLVTKPNSFPILTMDTAYRAILKPKNDWFVELDYNAAELRVLLGLQGTEQPQGDLHAWNALNVLKTKKRETSKKKIFTWLYGNKKNDKIEQYYKRELVKQKYWDGKNVKTVFGREIESDDHHAINYIIQSTAADMFLRQMVKVWKKINNTKTEIAFCMHDSIILDFSEKDMNILKSVKNIFADTQFGKFEVNVKVGKDYLNMQKLAM
tara:strand:- start:4468 stop:5661 length:1194 start_codon:yes stop_codon:yes gene_type:complete